MMSGQSNSPVMHDACEDVGQNNFNADAIVFSASVVPALFTVRDRLYR
eukprot:COSAG05_NODE_188_length_14697_cov_11.861145_6_plen_48_part_00